MLPPATLREMRARFRTQFGDAPLKEHEASDAQLTALEWARGTGTKLFADFGVWGPIWSSGPASAEVRSDGLEAGWDQPYRRALWPELVRDMAEVLACVSDRLHYVPGRDVSRP